MSDALKQLLNDVMSLPTPDRARLAALLIESLDEPADLNAEEAWSDEIRHRLEQIDRGEVQMIPWHEAQSRIRGENGPASD